MSTSASKDYSEVAKAYRPGHADYAYDAKYGIPRLSRRRAFDRARDRGAGRGGRGGAAGDPRGVDPRLRQRDRRRCDRSGEISMPSEIGNNPFFCPDAEAAARWEKLVDEARKAGSSARRGGRMRRDRRAGRLGRADLWQARCGPRRGDDGDQCGQGRGDRRRLRCGALRGEENADPMRPGAERPPVPRQSCGRDRGRHLHRAAGGGARGVQADQFDPDPGR